MSYTSLVKDLFDNSTSVLSAVPRNIGNYTRNVFETVKNSPQYALVPIAAGALALGVACSDGNNKATPTSSPSYTPAQEVTASPTQSASPTPTKSPISAPTPTKTTYVTFPPETTTPSPTAEPIVTPIQVCDFSDTSGLRQTTEYGIFGKDTFDTLVCGYMKINDDNAYFVISEYLDQGFIDAVATGVTGGNTVNRKGPSHYEFRLGCFRDGRIIGVDYDAGDPDSMFNRPYIDAETESAILNSSPEDMVTLKLSFGEHLGADPTCVNLAHEVQLVE